VRLEQKSLDHLAIVEERELRVCRSVSLRSRKTIVASVSSVLIASRVHAIGFAKPEKIHRIERVHLKKVDFLIAVSLAFLAACDRSKPAAESPTPSVQQQRAESAAAVPESTQRHWTFLNRLRQEDEYSGVIHRTQLNKQNELGVVLYSSVALETVPDLMRKVMTAMAHKFPQEDLTLTVYQVATPPKQIGMAHLDGKTGEATYTPL
jgi:hypothetical protein